MFMVDAILGLIGTLLYPLFSIVFVIISLLQRLFYSFAGIGDDIQYGSLYSGSGEANAKGDLNGMGYIPITGSKSDGGRTTTGIVYFILNSNIVKNIFISIAILALFLIIIFSTLAALKSIYSEKPKSWKDIATNAIKGLFSFIILPVCCLLGVWVGNIILQAVAGATAQGGTIYLDRQLFLSCAYNANTYRINSFTNLPGDKAKQDEAYDSIKATIEYYGLTEAYGGEVDATNDEGETIKNLKSLKRGQDSEYYARIVDQMYGLDRIPIHNWITVGVGAGYYQLWNINYLLLIVGGVFMMYVLINVTYGMVKRLFILMMLFVISPAICAMYPLDEGNAVKSWTGDVKKNILSAYGAVAGMNLFFSFAPVIKNINFTLTGVAALSDIFFVSDIIQLILLICGLFCVNEFISMISGYFGAGNAFTDGKSLRGSATGALKKYGKATVEKGVKIGGAFVRADKARADRRNELKAEGQGKSFTRFFRSVGTGALQLGQEGLTGLFNTTNKAVSGALGLESKAIKPGDGVKKAWESTGLGKVIKAEQDADKEAEKNAANSASWKKLISNLSEAEKNDPAVLAELKRQMLSSGIKEEDLYKKGYLGKEEDKGVIEEKIARFNEMDYDDRKADLEKARKTINEASSKDSATREKESKTDAVSSSGKVYIDAKDAEIEAGKAETKADSALSTAQANFDSASAVIMTDDEKGSRLSMGLAGKYSDEELREQAGDKALFDCMKNFNDSLEALVHATEEQQKAMQEHTKATENAKKSLADFEKALKDAKDISKEASKEIENFGEASGKVQDEVDELTKKLREESKKNSKKS